MAHIWSFSTVGGVKRVNLESGEDLKHLKELDQKLWTALSCPVNGLEIDHRTLDLIDKDKDGQIRVPEIIEAVNWIISVLKDANVLLKEENTFLLDYINDQTEAGKELLSSAKIILKNLGQENARSLSVEQTSDIQKIFANSPFNGDGIITEDSTTESHLKKLIKEIGECIGTKPDRGGKDGIDSDIIEKFAKQCNKYHTWQHKKESDIANILPFGETTAAAHGLYVELKNKIDDFYLRCKLATFDQESIKILNGINGRLEAITNRDLIDCLPEIAGYPLAKIESGKPMPLQSGINPAWETKFKAFYETIVIPLFGKKDVLTETEWQTIVGKFSVYESWINEKAGDKVESLGLERVREILNSEHIAQLNELIKKDKEVEKEANSIILVDQLVRYHRDLFKLLKNFVTFFDFYSPGSKAIFQAGTLYIDQRSCDLCIKVTDMAKHNTMAASSGMYLMYCDCTCRATNEKMTIVAALTNGDIDNLVVGRNALFYDRNGQDWDATVVKIIDNPISIRQAFFSPYRKVSNFIETQINKVAASQDSKVTEDMSKSIESIPVKSDQAAAPKPPAQPFDIGKFVGIFAAISLALGAIGTAIASAVAGFLGLQWWKMPFALLGLLLLISGPAMIMAFLKLRKRNLAPILDANGWAINARAIVNIHFGNTLTHLADLPKGAKINLNDPFTKKKRPFIPIVIFLAFITGVVLFLLWKYGYIHINI